MYDEQILVNHLRNETGFKVYLSTEKQIDIVTEEITVPKLYVGHVGVHLENPTSLWSDGYKEEENSQVLLTEIQVLCLRNDLSRVRNAVYAAYVKFDAEPDNPSSSLLSFVNAKVLGRTGTKIWWLETVAMVFPRLLTY